MPLVFRVPSKKPKAADEFGSGGLRGQSGFAQGIFHNTPGAVVVEFYVQFEYIPRYRKACHPLPGSGNGEGLFTAQHPKRSGSSKLIFVRSFLQKLIIYPRKTFYPQATHDRPTDVDSW